MQTDLAGEDQDGDVDLVGEGQIVALKEDSGWEHFDLVLSSPLQRARKTAAVFGDPIVRGRPVEIDLGRWDGLTTSEIVDSHRPDLDPSPGRGGARWGPGETPADHDEDRVDNRPEL